MMIDTQLQTHCGLAAAPQIGLRAIQPYFDDDTYVYVLKKLYGLVFYAYRRDESVHQLKRRLARFEQHAGLPRLLSSLPMIDFLDQLEDAQYLYPICRRETTLPRFQSKNHQQ